MKNDKPIAVLASTIADGFRYLNTNYEVKIINKNQGRAVTIEGQEYFIVTEGIHLHGRDFSSFIETDEFSVWNPDSTYIREAIKLRIR